MNKYLSVWWSELLAYLILFQKFSKYAYMKDLHLGQWRILKMMLMHD
jgi:hypothetical protein